MKTGSKKIGTREVNTTKGKVSVQDVNKILIHEHMLIDMRHEAIQPEDESAISLFSSDVNHGNIEMLRKNPYCVLSNLLLDDVEMAISELTAARDSGVDLLVDVTSEGLRRDVTKLQQISDATNVHIVAGCGLFTHDSLPEKCSSWSIQRIADWMIGDINEGIDGTGIKAGIIGEIGTSEVIYPIEERSLFASACAYRASGLPIMLHIYPWSEAGLDAAQLLLSEGVPPEKICICHVDVTFNESFIFKLLNLGLYIGFDNFGKEFELENQSGAFAGGSFETDERRVSMLSRLCSSGYTNRILLANDVCLKSLLGAYGGNGYVHLFRKIIPMMQKEGLDEETIDLLTDRNQKAFLFETA